jgi:pyridoxine/pyridoxamine 5'-phosphate oxidase
MAADAIKAGVTEPHAMTLSTVDMEGHSDARLIACRQFDCMQGGTNDRRLRHGSPPM